MVPGQIHADSSCSALLRITTRLAGFRVRSCHALWLYFPEHSLTDCSCQNWSYNPTHAVTWVFGLFPVRSPLLGESLFIFLFPAGTKMFQVPLRLASRLRDGTSSKVRVCPIRKSADQRSFAPTRSLSQLKSRLSSLREPRHGHVPLLTFVLPITYGRYILSALLYFFWSHHVKIVSRIRKNIRN